MKFQRAAIASILSVNPLFVGGVCVLPSILWKGEGNTDVTAGPDNFFLTGRNSYGDGYNGNNSKAFSFDGVDDYLSLYEGSPLSESGFTMSLWVKPDISSIRELEIIFIMFNGPFHSPQATTYLFLWGTDEGTLLYLWDQTTNEYTYLYAYVSNNVWIHTALTYDSSAKEMEFYLNGAFLSNITNVTIPPPTVFQFGSFGSYYFNGMMDEIAFYDKALTADEVDCVFNDFDAVATEATSTTTAATTTPESTTLATAALPAPAPTPPPTPYSTGHSTQNSAQTPAPTPALTSPSQGFTSSKAEVDLPNDIYAMEFVNNTLTYNSTTNVLRFEYFDGKIGNTTLSYYTTNFTASRCSMDSPADNVNPLPNKEPALESGDNSKLVAGEVELELENISSSNIFYDTSSETAAEIRFCIRADKSAAGYNVSFSEMLVTLKASLTADFEIESIGADRTDPSEQEANANFAVDACLCGSDNKCTDNKVLSQNSPYSICLTAASDGLSVASVRQIDVFQGGTKKNSPVKNGVSDGLTTEAKIEKGIKMTTYTISAYYESATPEDIEIQGTVLLEYDGSRRRALVGNVFSGGMEKDEQPSTSFELTLQLEPLSVVEEIATDQEEEKNGNGVVVEDQEEQDNEVGNKNGDKTLPVNIIVGAFGAVSCAFILALGFRSRARSDMDVGVKYDGVVNSA